MKKLLLSLFAVFTAMSMSAESKTVTFDFNASQYGYKLTDGVAALAVGDKITNGDITITAATIGTTPVRFYTNATTNVVTLRMATGCAISVEAGGANITKIEVTGNNVAAKNVTVDAGTWSDKTWEGSATKVTLTRADATVQFQTMAVTYDAKESGSTPTSGTFDDLYVPLKFDGVNYKVNDEWANAVIDQENGKSEVKFSTPNIEFVAVGGTTPKNVPVTDSSVEFAGWTEGWNDVKWDKKGQNLDDAKTRYFAYIVGTGNPVIETSYEYVEGNNGNIYRPKYVYYGPVEGNMNGKDYKRSLPSQGLYYEFAAKKDGTLKIAVWSNKGKRNTFVIDKATMEPVTFTCEGYYNGQNEADPNNEGKNQKKWLTNDDFVTLHDNAFKRQAVKNEDGTTKVDEEGNTVYEACEDTYPYVIADGNQNFWGYLIMPLKAGQTYLLFQDSSQIGFAGFQFTDGKVAEGDLFSAKASVFLPEGIAKVEGVTYNGDETFTAAAGTEVTITFKNECTQYTLTGVTGTITPSTGSAWVVKSAENGTVVVAYEGTSETPKYAVSFTSDAAETFSIANTSEVSTAVAATFDDITLDAENTVKYFEGETPATEWTSGSYTFSTYTSTYGTNKYYSSYAVSNKTTTAGKLNDYALESACGGAKSGSNYAVWYDNSYNGGDVIKSAEAGRVTGVYVTNTTSVVDAVINGDGMSTVAGGFQNADVCTLTFTGYNQGAETGKVEFKLAYAENDVIYYAKDWKWVSLRSLGVVDNIKVAMTSTKANNYGATTPLYFCLDDFGGVAPNKDAEYATAAIADAIANIIAPSAVRNGKFIQNGKVIIIKNGIKYNVAGQVIN